MNRARRHPFHRRALVIVPVGGLCGVCPWMKDQFAFYFQMGSAWNQ